MPSTYAHYIFGQNVMKNLNNDIKKKVIENKDLFNIGLHGPDILFYYQPLSSNKVNNTGNKIHDTSADVFFYNGKKVVRDSNNSDASLSYLIGFICHFMLDSECHPYVDEQIENSNISHNRIETEFDRFLMEKDELNPIIYKPTEHIVPTMGYSKIIAPFFSEISIEKVYKSLKSMKFYLNLLVVQNRFKRILIVSALKISGNYEKMNGLLMDFEPYSACKDSNIILEDKYNNYILSTADLINEFYKNINNDRPLNQRFLRNFI